MGNEQSRIAEETQLPAMEVAWLQERYHVLTQRNHTTRDDPVKLNEAQFVGKFPESQSDMAKMLFHAMDTGKTGEVDFRHFCIAVAALSRGSEEQKIDFAFRLYDRDGKGYIEAADVASIAAVFKATCGKLASTLPAGPSDGPREQASAEKDAAAAADEGETAATSLELDAPEARIAATLMAHMDPEGTGRVTNAQFAAFCRRHREITEQVQQAYVALRRAAMFDWSQPHTRAKGDECCVA